MLASPSPAHPSILDEPLIAFGREVCGVLPVALRREWLLTDGLGGYASGTVAGVNTRRYHGLLVAALAPPAARTVLVAALDEWLTIDGIRYPLSTHEWADGTIAPDGYRYLESFELRGRLPVWTYLFEDVRIEKRVWTNPGHARTFITYRLIGGAWPVQLDVTPLCTYRDFHALTRGGWTPAVDASDQAATITAWPGARPYSLIADSGDFTPSGVWYWNFLRRAERERGLDDTEDLYAPGAFRFTLTPGETRSLLLAEGEPAAQPPHAARALASAEAWQRVLLQRARRVAAPRPIQQLVLAADQFLVARDTATERGRTVIAGYHWFGDWGRDTMIALPGLTLAAGRPSEAADVLRTFARHLSEGMLPNRFPDYGDPPEYNTVDATLWWFVAIYRYHQATADETLIDDLLPALRHVIDWHVRGTRHGIKVDQADGLLHCGEPGVQLTWMDAKAGDWVVTPRTGKPVEVNALWHAALRILAALLTTRDAEASARYAAMAERAAAGFRARFWLPHAGYLADVVDPPDGGADVTLRPNQIFTVSLPFPLLTTDQARSVVDIVGRRLLTSLGLRTLDPADARYRGAYRGGVLDRDGAYHQGTVWPWLLAPYAEAHHAVHHDRAAARAILAPLMHHLHDAGLGSISEVADGDPPFTPGGCVAQAWSVAETLRVWRDLED